MSFKKKPAITFKHLLTRLLPKSHSSEASRLRVYESDPVGVDLLTCSLSTNRREHAMLQRQQSRQKEERHGSQGEPVSLSPRIWKRGGYCSPHHSIQSDDTSGQALSSGL